MAIMRIECPECGAGLKSPTGFAAGQSVACPKCETYFTVEEPEEERPAKSKKAVKAVSSRDDDDDEEDEKPKKKKKKKSRDDDDDDDDDEGGGKSYKTSPLRFIVLGILVVIMAVLGIMLVVRKMDEKKQNEGANAGSNEEGAGPPEGQVPVIRNLGAGVPKLPMIIPNMGGVQPPPPVLAPPPPAGIDPIAGLFGQSPRAGTDESVKLLETHRKKLLGMWEGTAADGALHKIVYQDNGQFTHEISGGGKGSTSAGTWNIMGLVGTRGVKINRGTVKLKVVFEGDELLHDTATPGETVVLKKK